MDIAVLGYRRERRNDLEGHIVVCLGDNSPYTVRQYGMDEPVYNREPPPNTACAFVIIDDVKALHTAQSVAGWGDSFPLTMAAIHPEYAMEGIRLKVKHYFLFPLEQKDIREALVRMGIPV